jgi:ubiquinone/menaquinone biosynthesis C-methylase UbiE
VTYSDPEYVTRQYRDAVNLETRIALHERFSTNPYGLPRWIFDQIEVPDGASILEVGCGPGRLWTENVDRLPKRWNITLTDASPGMISEARRNLGGSGQSFEFQVADVQRLPFESGRFDAVIANYMLYHVPDRPSAHSEISRVLKPGGTLYAATNGAHTQSEMGWMQRILDPSRPTEGYFREPLGFSLENGAGQLSPRFSDVTLRRYEDALAITEVEPLVAYLLSGSAAHAALRESSADEFDRRVSDLIGRLEQELAQQGTIRIHKDTGLFIARN